MFQKSALALIAVVPCIAGFVAHPTGRSPTTLEVAAQKELTPPRDLDELTKELEGTQDLYANVQKTYG